MEKYLDTIEVCGYLMCVGLPRNVETVKQIFTISGCSETEEWQQLPDGTFHGTHTSVSGNIKKVSFWKDGRLHGISSKFKKGELVKISEWFEGELISKKTMNDKFVSREAHFKDKELHGLERAWIKGVLYTETEWFEGKMHGKQKTFDTHGKLCSVSFWEHGIPNKVLVL